MIFEMHGKLCLWRQLNVIFQQSPWSIKRMYHGLILNYESLFSELWILVLKKRRLWRKAKSSRDPANWAQYKSFSNRVKDNLNKANWKYVTNLTASLPSKPKKFWSFVNSRTGNLVFPVVLNTMVNLPLRQKGKLIYLINSFLGYLAKDLEKWIMRFLHFSLRPWLMI